MHVAKIPDSFAAVLAATDAVCAEFNATAPFRHFDGACWVRDISIIHDDDVAHVSLILDTDRALLAIYVILQMPDAKGRIDALARTTVLANYGLLPGCFELDTENGDMRYRCVFPLISHNVVTRDIAQILAEALLVARAYASAFQKVAARGMAPELAIAEVES